VQKAQGRHRLSRRHRFEIVNLSRRLPGRFFVEIRFHLFALASRRMREGCKTCASDDLDAFCAKAIEEFAEGRHVGRQAAGRRGA
jgi:hypothetical protein